MTCSTSSSLHEFAVSTNATTYPFCKEHRSLFAIDDLDQCLAWRNTMALSMFNIKVEDFAGATVADMIEKESK